VKQLTFRADHIQDNWEWMAKICYLHTDHS